MTTARAKRERLEARITPDQKALFQRAASLEGRTMTDFVVYSAQRAAEDVIRAHQIALSGRDSIAFVEALLNPPAPNDLLRAAAQRLRAFTDE